MILLIDNYDSFTYNIFQYLKRLNNEVVVKRNNVLSISEIEKMKPSHIIISPGPGRPDSAGISVEAVRHFKGKIPMLGICLGHQCIGDAFGGSIIRSPQIYHGKGSDIFHDGKGIFNGIRNPFQAIRYHSLTIHKASLPDELEISAWTDEGEIMAVRHKLYTIVGLQFHPESIGTSFGLELLKNFVNQNPETSIIQSAITKVFSRKNLTIEEAEKVMDEITSGDADPAQIACMLTALGLKGESVTELTGFARVMRKKATKVRRPVGKKLIDTCGTGGDASGTFNISTTAAFVTAGAGVMVAKHGNRSVTSRCGSADLLEALGLNIMISPEIMTRALEEVGITFLFAPKLHSAMKHAVPVRASIGLKTAFNILGPLSNPAGADYQIIGVFDRAILDKVAKTLVNLGIKRGMVVHGSDGLDEITLTGKTNVAEIKDGWIRNYQLDPLDFGFDYCSAEDLKGGDLKANCEIVLSILEGRQGPRRDVVVLNAAAAIYLSGKANNMKKAVEMAQNSLNQGTAQKKMQDLIAISNN